MKGRIAGVALACALAACAEKRPEPPALLGVTAAPGEVAVALVVSGIPPGYRVEEVTLIDPAGGRHPAESLVPVAREASAIGADPTIGIGVTGGSSSGVHPYVSLGVGPGSGAQETRRDRLVRARVPLAEPAAFRAARWRTEVVYLDVTGERRRIVVRPVPGAP